MLIRYLRWLTLALLLPFASAIAPVAGDAPASMPTPRTRVETTYTAETAPQPAARRTSTPVPTPTATPSSTGMRMIPDPLYGVTIDDISSLSAIRASLAGMNHMPTARIVFDRQEEVSYYASPIEQLQSVSYLVGSILDSSDVSAVSTSAYTQRTQQFLAAFGAQIDLWEVGNEINGEWLGTNADVIAKMTGAYDLVHTAGKRTALTLYYNGLDDTNNCYSNQDNLMFRWAQAYVPDRIKLGLDYVFISFYDQDCPGVSHDWTTIFTQLHQMFPNSKIGFGENGTRRASDPSELKQQYMDTYYRLPVPVPNYVHGHFWWYYREDCVLSTKPLWSNLNDDFAQMPVT